jgi:hypothetical protein
MKNNILMTLVVVVTLPMTMVGMEQSSEQSSNICWLARVPDHVWNTHLMPYLMHSREPEYETEESDQTTVERLKSRALHWNVYPGFNEFRLANNRKLIFYKEKDTGNFNKVRFEQDEKTVMTFNEESQYFPLYSESGRSCLIFNKQDGISIYDMNNKKKKKFRKDQFSKQQDSLDYHAISNDGSMVVICTSPSFTVGIQTSTCLYLPNTDYKALVFYIHKNMVTKIKEIALPKNVKKLDFNARATHIFAIDDEDKVVKYLLPTLEERPQETFKQYLRTRLICNDLSKQRSNA